ncbi:MAG: hypothetical protein PUA51_02205 [Oscillospiraceae bacterium]|nr:hypothetical protein [Oscillospiraceae bacterium]
MDISPFYELRNRLYCTASAGCSAINEDFRLKRAVESFQTLATANKAFGKLYAMCLKLFESDNISSLLADCIALADALAVTQGTFNVSDETLPYENNTDIKPLNMYYSEYHTITEMLSNPSKYINLRTLDGKQLQFIYDPRFLSLFLKKLKEGTNSEYFSEFAYTVCRSYGKSIVPALKSSLDISNPKANGNAVKYISDICGADENDWYLELALNEGISPDIRENAVKALSCSPENTDTLLELYRTQKGKVKNSAIHALAVINPPEAEPIWEKMTKNPEKVSENNMKYIGLSSNKICSDFAQKYICGLMEKIEELPKKSVEANKMSIHLLSACNMLENKTDILDFILRLMDFSKESKKFAYYNTDTLTSLFNRIAVNNVINHPDEPSFRELAANLYEYDKNAFLRSEFFIRLLENPDTAFEIVTDINSEQRKDIIDILNNIWYLQSERKYYISPNVLNTARTNNIVPVFENIPESMLDFITDRHSAKNNTVAKALEKVLENIGQKTTTAKNQMEEKCSQVYSVFRKWLESCNPEDFQKIKKYASEFVFSTVYKFPSYMALWFISDFLTDEEPEKYKDIFYNYISVTKSNENQYYFNILNSSIDFFDKFPLSDEEKLNELIRIEKLLKYVFRENKHPANEKREFDTLRVYIQKYSAKGNN